MIKRVNESMQFRFDLINDTCSFTFHFIYSHLEMDLITKVTFNLDIHFARLDVHNDLLREAMDIRANNRSKSPGGILGHMRISANSYGN